MKEETFQKSMRAQQQPYDDSERSEPSEWVIVTCEYSITRKLDCSSMPHSARSKGWYAKKILNLFHEKNKTKQN